jgi:mRNA-degrading endonuclease RelE of RelBE toxin-antitoxin system
MSVLEILEELPKLTAEDRDVIRLRLAELDGDGWLDDDDPLTDSEKSSLKARLEDLTNNPEKSLSWAEAEARRAVNPLAYRVRSRRSLFRWMRPQKFPYRIVYTIDEHTITILALIHSSRGDRAWKARA